MRLQSHFSKQRRTSIYMYIYIYEYIHYFKATNTGIELTHTFKWIASYNE